jgi:prevent-host-death family protein
MLNTMSVSQVRANLYNVIEQTTKSHEPILITGEKSNAVILSQEDWKAIEETLYLNSIPNMANSIQESMNADDSEFSENIQW